MKTLTTLLIFLCVSASLRLCVSASLHETSSAALQAGAATSNITPHLGTSLDGPISRNGPAAQIHDELHAHAHAHALVLDDGTTRLAIVVVDSTMVVRSIYDAAKAIIEERTGLPANRVLVSATHSHATPRSLPGLTDNPSNAAYHDFLSNRIADAVECAIGNLAPAQVGWSSFEKPGYVHNRRWFVEPGKASGNPFGDVGETVKMNPGRDGLIKPAGPVDPEIFVLSVQHQDGRPLALLANYSTHYVGGYRRGHISADYFGIFATRIGKLLGATSDQHPPFVGIMSNGTSGDVNTTDKSKPKPKPTERVAPFERMRTIAHDIAADVHSLYPKIEHRSDLSLAMEQKEISFAIRKPSAPRLAWAKKNFIPDPGPTKRLTRSQVYARELLKLSEYPDKVPILLQAIRIGELAIASSPCEAFAETGLAIKEGSPFPATFTIGLANGAEGYLPTAQQHKWGGYETWPARSSLLEVNAETKIRATLIELLKQLKL